MKSFRITGSIKEYAWGTRDFITNLTGIKSNSQIAEYWLGTHYLGPAHCEDGTPLLDKLDNSLPFLFKILSINTPLAIQSHPTKAQAHAGFYQELVQGIQGEQRNYQDTNDKTEAFIALTDCYILYGFKQVEEICRSFEQYIPHTQHLLGNWANIKDLYDALFALPQQDRKTVLQELKTSVLAFENKEKLTSVDEIINRCTSLYPDDICNLFPLMMNFLVMKSGQCVFIQPNLVHAYCFGNGIEIMTSSDNMVRLGLTKRPTDVVEFKKISILEPSDGKICNTDKTNPVIENYLFPQGAFRLAKINRGTTDFIASSHSILFVADGTIEVKEHDGSIVLKRGEAAFIPEKTQVTILSEGMGFLAGNH